MEDKKPCGICRSIPMGLSSTLIATLWKQHHATGRQKYWQEHQLCQPDMSHQSPWEDHLQPLQSEEASFSPTSPENAPSMTKTKTTSQWTPQSAECYQSALGKSPGWGYAQPHVLDHLDNGTVTWLFLKPQTGSFEQALVWVLKSLNTTMKLVHQHHIQDYLCQLGREVVVQGVYSMLITSLFCLSGLTPPQKLKLRQRVDRPAEGGNIFMDDCDPPTSPLWPGMVLRQILRWAQMV